MIKQVIYLKSWRQNSTFISQWTLHKPFHATNNIAQLISLLDYNKIRLKQGRVQAFYKRRKLRCSIILKENFNRVEAEKKLTHRHINSEGGTGEDRSDVTPLNFRTRLQIQEYLGRLFEKKSVKFSEKNCSLPQIKSVPPSLRGLSQKIREIFVKYS